MEKKSLSTGFVVMLIIGIILIIYALSIEIPYEHLSEYSSEGSSKIVEYFYGDTYNYIIGSNIVGSKIVAATIKKAIFICFGLFMTTFSIGTLIYGRNAVEQSSQAIPDNKEVNG